VAVASRGRTVGAKVAGAGVGDEGAVGSAVVAAGAGDAERASDVAVASERGAVGSAVVAAGAGDPEYPSGVFPAHATSRLPTSRHSQHSRTGPAVSPYGRGFLRCSRIAFGRT
jgi:hypothetical protein